MAVIYRGEARAPAIRGPRKLSHRRGQEFSNSTCIDLTCALADSISRSHSALGRDAIPFYNKALASRGAEAISRYWLLDSQSVWANGRLTVGHDNIVARYGKTFKDGDFLFGLRTPQRIDVDPAGVRTLQKSVSGNGRCAPQAKRSLGAAATLPCGRRWTATGAYGRISTSRLDVQAVAPVVDPLAQVTVPDRTHSCRSDTSAIGRPVSASYTLGTHLPRISRKRRITLMLPHHATTIGHRLAFCP